MSLGPNFSRGSLLERAALLITEDWPADPDTVGGKWLQDYAATKTEELLETRRAEILTEVRQALADYMVSEGCSCCQNVDAHAAAKARLAELLGVPMYDDQSGYDFRRYRTT